MHFDLRLPLGLLFVLLGSILTGYGAYTSGSEIYEKSLGINVNFWWGVALVLFGSIVLGLGLWSRLRSRLPDSSKPS